jgi:hypothetical protein
VFMTKKDRTLSDYYAISGLLFRPFGAVDVTNLRLSGIISYIYMFADFW